METITGLPTGLRMLCRALIAIAISLVVLGSPAQGAADEGPAPVYVVDISGTIDLGVAPYLDRVLDEAGEAGASAVLVEIDTPGGRLDAVLQMRDALLTSQLRTVALVESTAFSAGALVALASEEIYMRPGSVMGAATPVHGGTGETAGAKTISAVRSTFEATAEQRGRDPRIAGAMVDPAIAIDGVVEAGSLLTLTASEAVEVEYAEAIVEDRAALLEELGLADHEVVEAGPALAERLVRGITHPVVASLLLTIGMLAIIADLLSGGLGVGIGVGLVAMGLFFWGHTLAGLAGWEDVALVALGLLLIAVEIFVIPGFGVAGVLGLAAIASGTFFAMINRDLDFVAGEDLARAGSTVGAAFLAVILGLVIMLTLLARGRLRGGLVLRARVGVGPPVTERAPAGWLRWFGGAERLSSEHRPAPTAATAPTTAPVAPERAVDEPASLLGATGTALSDLRPSGVADIGGERVDVVTSGEYVRRDEAVEVVRDDGWRRVVRRRPG